MSNNTAQLVWLLPTGTYYRERLEPLVVTREFLKQVVANFTDAVGVFVADRSIEGRIGQMVRLLVCKDGLYGFVTWSEPGEKLVRDGRYPYLDPKLSLDGTKGPVLVDATLTARTHYKPPIPLCRPPSFITDDRERQAEVLTTALNRRGLDQSTITTLQTLFAELAPQTPYPYDLVWPLLEIVNTLAVAANSARF